MVLCFLLFVAATACGGTGSRIGEREPTKTWSGYAVDGNYTHVSASWVQPAVNCSVMQTAASRIFQGASFWAGFDGYLRSETIEQTGTTAYCSVNDNPIYEAWYQLYPQQNVAYAKPVKPGDKISASVTTDGNGHFILTLTDRSEGWTRRKTATSKTTITSAVVIAEAPTPPYQGYPPTLAEFGTVSFTGATADGKTFNDLNGLRQLDMVHNGKPKAVTSPIANGAFTVTWKHS